MFELRHHSEFFDLRIEMDLCFRGRDVAGRLEQAAVVEPVDPFEGGKLDRFETAPRSAPYDDFGFEEADDYFCEGVVIAVTDDAHGGLDASLGEALGAADGDILDASVAVMDHGRPRMACTCCEAICQAPLPLRPIERGRPGPGLLVHVLVSKYADHLPLYRQSQIFDRDGIDLDRSTLFDWVGKSAALNSRYCRVETRPMGH